ncbi:MAG: DUF5702 domain-containing protein [Anaerovoracaceae bacterium]
MTVYVMVFMTSLVMMFSLFIRASYMTAAESTVRTMAGLWSASILAEYDRCLKDRYDIFGYYGRQSEVNRKLRFYASKGLKGLRGIDAGTGTTGGSGEIGKSGIFGKAGTTGEFGGSGKFGAFGGSGGSGKFGAFGGSGGSGKFQISGSPSDFSLRDTEEFKKQVVVSGKLEAVKDAARGPEGHGGAAGAEGAGRGEDGKMKDGRDYKHTFFPTRSQTELFSDLPSQGVSSGLTAGSISGLLKSGGGSDDGFIDKTSNRYFEQRFIFSRFKDASDSHGVGKTYLDYEIEYLIGGKQSDKANKLSVKLKILAVREIFNMMFIMQDGKMNSETMAAAELITPGPAALLTQKAIQAAWAAAESENDYRLLVSGKKVPVFKDSVSWALDLDSIFKGGIPKDPDKQGDRKQGENSSEDPENDVNDMVKKDIPLVDPGNKKGLEYSHYLKAMLLSMDENVLLLRIMDVIQINMKYLFYSDFRMSDYCAGINTMISVNGKRYVITRMYQPTSDLIEFGRPKG